MTDVTSQANEALFVVRGLAKAYEGRRVLDGLDFEVRHGECLVILGRSGSGKSVTLRQLNGLESADGGSVHFDGIEISALAERELFPIRRRIGMLFQGGALFDSLDIADNVAFPLREHTTLSEEEIARTVGEKLALVGLPDVEAKMPAELSGGMKKRAALARSLALDPEAMLFDEPTTGLDPITSATIGRLIQSIRADSNVTSVVVTHDVALARRIGDRLAFLEDGRFTFVGDWQEADRSGPRTLADFLAGREEEADAA
ncbi:MAG TPA: ATP-binding cassette domain-containing protein [Thermoanaerobaculia bacterium]|nr:ATP-binding cassette domain-containing protein [Thermoanaerobaculia bacterium]